MPRVRLIEWGDASAEVREVYEDIKNTRPEGVSRSFRACGNNIHLLRARWEVHKRLIYSETHLPRNLKEGIQLVVSKVMGCQG